MAKVTARASKQVSAPPDRVLAFLRDYQSRPQILTGNYSAYRIEAGGEVAGTVIAYHFAAGGREPTTGFASRRGTVRSSNATSCPPSSASGRSRPRGRAAR